jgi:hypothetical protein
LERHPANETFVETTTKMSFFSVCRFINWQADAIRRTDPTALVTAGSWRQLSQSGAFGGLNLYSDDCLVKAGGKPQVKRFISFY